MLIKNGCSIKLWLTGNLLMIETEKLSFKYNESDFAIQLENLKVNEGEKLCIHGPSGTGKSTIMKLLSGELVGRAEKLTICGEQILQLSENSRASFRLNNLGLIFQTPSLIDWMTIEQNLYLPLPKVNSEVKQKTQELLQHAKLENSQKLKPSQLSVGEQQRIAVIRALLPGHPLILADEPTANLDEENRQLVFDLILAHSSTLLYISHNEKEINQFEYKLNSKDWCK